MIDWTFDEAFQARHLAVPMSRAFAVEPRQDAQEALDRLRGLRFDQAPVIDDGSLLGFILTRRLDQPGVATVEDAMTALGSGNVVSADASIGRLIEWIIDPGLLFVLEGRDVTGFISVSDFNKQPVRGYLYLLLARLEIALASLIRSYYPEQERALEVLSPEGQRIVRQRFEGDRNINDESELLAYFDFSDLVQVVGANHDLLQAVGHNSRSAWADYAGGLVVLRHEVMHPVRNSVIAKGGLIKLHEREQRIRHLIERLEDNESQRSPLGPSGQAEVSDAVHDVA